MKTYLLFWILAVGLCAQAFGMAGELTQPGLAFPEGFPESARTNIMAALRRPDCKYLSGGFINWITTLNYGGDTAALNRFLEGLAACPGIHLSVRFSSESTMAGCDWMIASHSANVPYQFVVRVNLKSARIRLEELIIPESVGTKTSGL